MIKKIIAVLIIGLNFLYVWAQEKALVKGIKITKSTKIKKNIYWFDAAVQPDQAVVFIEGENITVDFNNAILSGSNAKQNPDDFFGIGIIISNSKNITIKNLKAKGYKIALFAKDVESLTLENCDFSYNYRQHLNSSQEKEDISDWMSYHHNENDEWMRYGAGMYLRNCSMAIIRNCKITGGQNALMMASCNDALIYNNDFSFNSGIGLGMYRCSRNKIAYNKIDFNVRGYSHGIYNRGQDSAGILVYEQSSENLFYKNSVTHGGDGFFLWAGQTTMDTGKGGCNDNVLSGNDFSYAPTNGIEVTFSRNKIINNRVYECDNGIWGGYSYESDISRNKFRFNHVAIAIEHGQENNIHQNIFYQDKEAIRLWSRNEQPADWGYAKYRDTRSRNYAIVLNSFNENNLVYNINHTTHLNIFGNIYSHCNSIFKIDSTVTALDTTENARLSELFSTDESIVEPYIEKPIEPFKGSAAFAGRKNILITEWGPYDFRSPIIWNTNPADSSDVLNFDLKGPKGKWKVKSIKGVDSLSAKSGEFPATITAKKLKEERTDISIQLDYIGSTITTPMGEVKPAGKPYTFSFRKFFQPVNWAVSWYAFDSLSDPVKDTAEISLLSAKSPIKTENVNTLDYAWWGGIKGDRQYEQFMTIAMGSANFSRGVYELGVTWDDAVRVYVDNKLVVNEWNPSLYKFDESPHRIIRLNLAGVHTFRVEHVELGGFAVLSLKFKKL